MRRAGEERGAVRLGTLFALLALLVVLGIVGWLWWQTFGVEPQRSIARAGRAYTAHEWEAFEPFVDVESVVDRGIEELLPDEVQGGGLLGLLGEGFIESQKPELVRRTREGLKRAVETEPRDDNWLRRQSGYLAPLRSDVRELSRQEARVLIQTNSRYGMIEVRMVPRAGRWVVVEVLNLPEVLARAGVSR